MDTNRFDEDLGSALKDPAGQVWTSGERTSAMLRAVREYSRYVPALRRMGEAVLCRALEAGATQAKLLGGPLAVGQSLTIDALGRAETRTILDVAPVPLGGEDGPAVLVTLSSALAFGHSTGVHCVRDPLGLALEVDANAYALPCDMVRPEQESFDLAVGARGSVRKGSGFYDAVYTNSARYSGAGSGYRQNYGGGWHSRIGPGGVIPQPLGETVYRFHLDGIPRLSVVPTPTAARTLDFFYYGQHLPETVPDHESETLLLYALYSALSAKAAERARALSGSEKDSVRSPHLNAKTLQDLAESALKQWDLRIRHRPYATTG
jgi:hypothetical protein